MILVSLGGDSGGLVLLNLALVSLLGIFVLCLGWICLDWIHSPSSGKVGRWWEVPIDSGELTSVSEILGLLGCFRG